MLILGRREGDSILIEGGIRIVVVSCDRGGVRLGISTKAAEDDAAVYGSLVEQGDVRRQSVSGVSTDEELVNMMRVQQSYTAATKLIKTADEMLQTLLSLI